MSTGSRTARDLGSISAENDNKFAEHFIATPGFARLLEDDCMIVGGAKGSGKTAIMRALTDIQQYRYRYATVFPIQLDGLKFAPLFTAIKRLDETSQHGLVAIARAAWQNVIAMFALEAVHRAKLVPARERTEISKYLHAAGHMGTPVNDKLLGHLESVWRTISRLSSSSIHAPAEPLLGLHAQQQKIIAAFPADDKLSGLLQECMDDLRKSGKTVLLCLDGLDSVVEYSIESRDYLFAGLMDAVHKCATHPKLKGALVIKALIPKELAHGARRHLRDLDKIEQVQSFVHWDSDNLGSFIGRRLEVHTRQKNRPFAETWTEYFPERIKNEAHGIEEDSYSYILRHTLYRPRQLLVHVQRIISAWDERNASPAFRVDPSFIPKIVSETNHNLAEYVVNELALDFPTLTALLRSFRGQAPVIRWADLAARLERHRVGEQGHIEECFEALYNYGVFGLLGSIDRDGARAGATACRCGFMTPKVERHVTSGFDDSTRIAIVPMFSEYAGCKPSPVGPLVPVD